VSETSSSPAISVVVPSRDRAELLDACLASIRGALRPGDELIVADSASRDGSVAAVAHKHGATVVRCEIAGTSRARNAGWRSARHDLIAFIDDDVRVHEGWARALAETFASFGDASYITGRIGPPPTTTKYLVAQKTEADPTWLTGAADEVQGHAANLAVRRAALLDTGGFDEELGPGTPLRAAEDLDFFERLAAHGFRGRYEPAASGYHESWRDARDMFALHWSYGIGLGARLVKLARVDRARFGSVAKVTFVDDGIIPVFRMIRQRAVRWTMIRLTRLAGVLIGIVRALPRRIADGHFVARRRDQLVESRPEPR
jgi:glycosyltransferase involved in cell wall biosynthesis